MIIFKYLNKQLLLTVTCIAFVLMLVLITSRLIRYISEVANGGIALKFLFNLIVFRLPDILLMVLPISLLLGILLVFGRLYLDNEMAVFSSSGISLKQLSVYAMASVMLISLIAASLSLFVVPWGLRKVDQLFAQNANRTAFDTLSAGRFSPLGKGLSLYVETLSDDRKIMNDVFIARTTSNKHPSYQLTAQQGYLEVKGNNYSKFLVLKNGYRYEGDPGTYNYKVTKFDTYGIKLPAPAVQAEKNSTRGLATGDLLNANNLREVAELQWRISLPLLVPIIALLGIPLSRVNPRQGKYHFLIPAMLFYFTYLVLLSSMKKSVADSSISPWIGLWWVHLLFFGLALLAFSDAHKKVFMLFNPKIIQRK